MHEHSIVRALVARVESEARKRRATRVRSLVIALGELSGVEPGLLASAYALTREGTICRHADLKLHSVAARWGCRVCGKAPPPGQALRCPACAGEVRLLKGDEIVLERIEMEVP